MRPLVIGFGMIKTAKSLEVEKLLLMNRLCTRIGQSPEPVGIEPKSKKSKVVNLDELPESIMHKLKIWFLLL
jgi:hypothetical protein